MDIKIRVGNPEFSELVQKELFKLGFTWALQVQEVQHTEEPFLYARVHSYEDMKRIRHGASEHYFNEDNSYLIDVPEIVRNL